MHRFCDRSVSSHRHSSITDCVPRKDSTDLSSGRRPMPKSVVAAIPTVAGRVLTLMEFRSMGTQSVIVIEPYAGVETPTGHKSDAHFGSETVQRNPNPSTSYNIARCSLGPGSDGTCTWPLARSAVVLLFSRSLAGPAVDPATSRPAKLPRKASGARLERKARASLIVLFSTIPTGLLPQPAEVPPRSHSRTSHTRGQRLD